MFTKYVRGMVYWADIPKYDINPNIQNGKRPVIIVSNNVANCVSNNVTIVPCTTNTDKNPNQPTHCKIALNPREDSLVLCEDIITVHKSILSSFMGMLDEYIMAEIDECIKAALGLIDVKNPLLGNVRKTKDVEVTEAPTNKKHTGKRIASKEDMSAFINYYNSNGADKVMEKYGVPTKAAVYQRVQFYKRKIQEV